MAPSTKNNSNKIILAVLALLVCAVATIVIIGQSKQKPAQVTPANTNYATQINSLAPALFDAIGVAAYPGTPSNPVLPAMALTNQPALSLAGTNPAKPTIVFVGAEWCPYCAAQRWPLAAALARFGHFKTLHPTASSATDVLPNTPTISLFNSGYSSAYFNLVAVEQATNTHAPLQKTPADVQALMNTYDSSKYNPNITIPGKSIPFLDINNQYLQLGVSFNPQVLAGLSTADVASQLTAGTTPAATTIASSANLITAEICAVTHGQPGSVCSSAGVQAAAKVLAKK